MRLYYPTVAVELLAAGAEYSDTRFSDTQCCCLRSSPALPVPVTLGLFRLVSSAWSLSLGLFRDDDDVPSPCQSERTTSQSEQMSLSQESQKCGAYRMQLFSQIVRQPPVEPYVVPKLSRLGRCTPAVPCPL